MKTKSDVESTYWIGGIHLTVSNCLSQGELDDIGQLRATVYGHEQGASFPNGRWLDRQDECATHWLGRAQEQLVASARVSLHDQPHLVVDMEAVAEQLSGLLGPIASFNRLVVKHDFRRRGIGRALDELRIAHAKSIGARTIVVRAVPLRRASLVELGFAELCIVPTKYPAFGFTHVHIMAMVI